MARVRVERKRRSHHPFDEPVIAFVPQQLDKVVVVAGVGGFAASALAEGELLAIGCGGVLETVRVDVDSLGAALAASQRNQLPLLEVTARDHMEGAVGPENDTGIHARRGGQLPAAINLEVFRVH